MKTVNISDIEELILCKHEIDLILIEKGDQEKKMKLDEFMKTYINLNDTVYVDDADIIPFSVVDVYGSKYMFVNDSEERIAPVVEALEQINYDFSNLKEVSNRELIERGESRPLMLIQGRYYDIY